MFGYPIEPDFDLAKEKRRDRAKWLLWIGTGLCLILLMVRLPLATVIFQGWVATCLFYGYKFYSELRADVRKPWIWKALIVSIPLHIAYLIAIIWIDRVFPNVATKAIVFIPGLAIGFGVESALIDQVIGRFARVRECKEVS